MQYLLDRRLDRAHRHSVMGHWVVPDSARSQTRVIWPISSCSVGLASLASAECSL